jgi:hypothetical protein
MKLDLMFVSNRLNITVLTIADIYKHSGQIGLLSNGPRKA